MTSQTQSSSAAATQAQYWIARIASGEFDHADAGRLQAWLAEDERHMALLERERATWRAMASLRDAFPAPVQDVQARPVRAMTRRRAWSYGIATLAACLALALWLPGGWLALRADHRTAAAVSSLTLEDGTRIALDADSAIAIDYSARQREVRLLRGGAWFEVARDGRPFQVQAASGWIRDIGTAFAVQLGEDGTRTSVAEGVVEISTIRSGSPVRLHAGQSAAYRKDGTLAPAITAAGDDVAPWRHREILLEAAPMDAALRQVARYREGPVWLVGNFTAAGRVDAVFDTDAPDEAISVLARMGGLRVQPLPGGILLIRPRGDG